MSTVGQKMPNGTVNKGHRGNGSPERASKARRRAVRAEKRAA